LEIGGVLTCLLLLAKVAREIKGGGELLKLWDQADKFFEKRRHLRRPKRETALDEDMVLSSDEARKLCFEIGEKLGFDPISCDTLIAIVGNPIAALKYLVAAGNEGRKLARLQQDNLLRLPDAGETTPIRSARSGQRRGPRGVLVESKGRRTKRT
jgi:hypothetical protein